MFFSRKIKYKWYFLSVTVAGRAKDVTKGRHNMWGGRMER